MIEKIVNGEVNEPTPKLTSSTYPFNYLKKDEFMKKYREIINNECKKTFPASISRDLKDTQIDIIGEQLFEMFEGISFDEVT